MARLKWTSLLLRRHRNVPSGSESPLQGIQFRAPSMRKLYALKWRLFTSWCGDHQLDPVNCPIGTVLEFLQASLSAGLTLSTIKVYVVAIVAYHAPLGGQSVGRNPQVTRLLHGALRLRPPVLSRVPMWDLVVVLEAFCKAPFEPIKENSDRFFTIKTAFLLAISSLKRVGDLQTLSVAPAYLNFAPGKAKEFLYPRVGYVHHSPSYYRPSVLLPLGSQTCRSLIELPCGEMRTNCFCARVPLRGICLLRNRPSVVEYSKPSLWLMSPLVSPRLWG